MTSLLSFAWRFCKEQDGQDLVEYTLLLGFVALAAAAFFPPVTRSISTIWMITSLHLSNAASAAS